MTIDAGSMHAPINQLATNQTHPTPCPSTPTAPTSHVSTPPPQVAAVLAKVLESLSQTLEREQQLVRELAATTSTLTTAQGDTTATRVRVLAEWVGLRQGGAAARTMLDREHHSAAPVCSLMH